MKIRFNILKIIFLLSPISGFGQWVTKAPMPTSRSGLASAVYNGKIYVLAGSGGTVNEEYDPVTNTWTSKAPAPTGRWYTAAVELNGLIYLIGGSSGGTPMANNEVYNPVTNTWATRAPMPTARFAHSLAVANGKIYAIGGRSSVSDVNFNEEYDPVSNTWATRAPIPTARSYFALVTVNNRLYQLSGGGVAAFNAIVQEYDPVANVWTAKTSIPAARHSSQATVVNNKIYTVGGYSGGVYLATNEIFDPVLNSWSADVPMITPRAYHTLATVGNCIYAIGGYDGPGSLPNNEEYCLCNTTVTMSPHVTICSGSSTTLNASGGTGYVWSPASGLSNPNISNPVANPTTTTGYTVTVTKGTCPPTTGSVSVTVNALPIANAGADVTICAGSSTTLNASGGVSYSWNPSTGLSNSTIYNPVASPAVNTIYTVTATGANGCTNTATVSIVSNALPIANAGTNATINYGNSISFNASGGGTYLWSPAAGLSCTTCQNPVANPTITTTYCVLVTDANGCTDDSCIVIDVEINCDKIFLPNVFSPNNDTENDVFYVMGDCISEMLLTIYDRWGVKVFETSDPATGWNGYYNGKPENDAVFVYYLTATLITDEKIIRKGNISLMR